MRSSRHAQLSLYEVTQKIQVVVEENFDESFWVSAEISEIKENRTGHCYLELVEKDLAGNQPKAKVRATIWAGVYRVIKPFFETAARVKLNSGIKILVLCHVNFHPVYGFSLNIQDIDPSYTVGDIEQKRKETIARLIAEGVFDMNRELEMPLLPKRIAIVSSPTAAGYQDFTDQLDSNSYGYTFHYKIFSAVVQGAEAEESVIDALNRINAEIEKWDVVAIIRGGGSQTDLSCFDSYALANHIAQFPLPVITGIGHEKDTTIADMVAYARLKTPTAAAEYIVNLFNEAEAFVISLKDRFLEVVELVVDEQVIIIQRAQNLLVPNVLKGINVENLHLQSISLSTKDIMRQQLNQSKSYLILRVQALNSEIKSLIKNEQLRIWLKCTSMIKDVRNVLSFANHGIEIKEKHLNALKPERVLNRGYSITLVNGKSVKSSINLSAGDEIETILHEGQVFSSVKKVIK